MTEYDRPNTVSGLKAKHKELFRLRDQHRQEIKRISADIEAVETCIRLFEAKANIPAMREHPRKPKSRRGRVREFVLGTLRESQAAMTSAEITKLWARHSGLQTDDATLTQIGKRISVCLSNCAKQGLIERDQQDSSDSPYKLWRLKRSA